MIVTYLLQKYKIPVVNKLLVLYFSQTVNDTAPEVREASFVALGTAMKVVTEKNIMAYLVDVDSIKMQKVNVAYTVYYKFQSPPFMLDGNF